jgi:hypothetical protein
MTSSTDLAVPKNLVGHIPKGSNSELPPLSSLTYFGGKLKNFPLITQKIADLKSLVSFRTSTVSHRHQNVLQHRHNWKHKLLLPITALTNKYSTCVFKVENKVRISTWLPVVLNKYAFGFLQSRQQNVRVIF